MMNDLRNEFRPIAERFRRNARIAPWAVFGCLLCVALAFWLKSGALFAIAFGSIALFFAGAIGIAIFAPIKCPGCERSPFGKLGVHCPECGAAALAQATRWHTRTCTSCGTTLQRGPKNARRWRIRFCTHCCGHLDDAGV